MLLLDLLLRRYLVNPHQRNLRPREPIHKRLGLCLCLLFSQGVKVRRVGRVVLINREVWGPQRLIGIRQADSIDAGRVANLLDAELAARAEAIERAVDVVRVHDVLYFDRRPLCSVIGNGIMICAPLTISSILRRGMEMSRLPKKNGPKSL